MKTPLKKRSVSDFFAQQGHCHNRPAISKQLMHEEGLSCRSQLHLYNLGAIFPNIDNSTLTQVYADCGTNINLTIEALETLQRESTYRAIQSPSPSKNLGEQQGQLEASAIDNKLSKELNEFEMQASTTLRNLSRSAEGSVDEAVDLLGKCKSSSEAKTILLALLDKVFGDTVEMHRSETSRLHVQYQIAKAVVLKQAAGLSASQQSKDRDAEKLQKRLDQLARENDTLRDFNKNLLRELELYQPPDPMYRTDRGEPGRDVF